MKTVPQLALIVAVAALLAKSLALMASPAKDDGRMGVSLAMQSGHVHFRAELGAGMLALSF